MQSFISDKLTQKRAYMLVAISSARFTRIAEDLRHYYPNATCVLFFRDSDVVEKMSPLLEEQRIPYAFYGSDTFTDELQSVSTCYYPEETIIRQGMEYLIDRYGGGHWLCVRRAHGSILQPV